MTHLPVLYHEVLHHLAPRPDGFYIDGTVGAGGHAAGILELTAPDGFLLGLDRDASTLEIARANLKPFWRRLALVNASYIAMTEAAQTHCPDRAPDGILLDLGLSSLQLDNPERGFAFMKDGPLDMRFDTRAPLQAADIVNTWSVSALTEIFENYGEERHSWRIAQAISAARPLQSTSQLADVILKAIGRKEKIHPATRVFQALRIAVNGELDAVAQVLPLAFELLKVGGRLAVISFHSLEDRLVKNYFRRLARPPEIAPNDPNPAPFVPLAQELTRKPIEATAEESATNPRARSAKLRVIEKIL